MTCPNCKRMEAVVEAVKVIRANECPSDARWRKLWDSLDALSESREEKVPAKKWEPCPKCGDEPGEPECDRCDGRGVVPAESKTEEP